MITYLKFTRFLERRKDEQVDLGIAHLANDTAHIAYEICD